MRRAVASLGCARSRTRVEEAACDHRSGQPGHQGRRPRRRLPLLRGGRGRGARPDDVGERRAGRRVPRCRDDHVVHPSDLRGRGRPPGRGLPAPGAVHRRPRRRARGPHGRLGSAGGRGRVRDAGASRSSRRRVASASSSWSSSTHPGPASAGRRSPRRGAAPARSGHRHRSGSSRPHLEAAAGRLDAQGAADRSRWRWSTRSRGGRAARPTGRRCRARPSAWRRAKANTVVSRAR